METGVNILHIFHKFGYWMWEIKTVGEKLQVDSRLLSRQQVQSLKQDITSFHQMKARLLKLQSKDPSPYDHTNEDKDALNTLYQQQQWLSLLGKKLLGVITDIDSVEVPRKEHISSQLDIKIRETHIYTEKMQVQLRNFLVRNVNEIDQQRDNIQQTIVEQQSTVALLAEEEFLETELHKLNQTGNQKWQSIWTRIHHNLLEAQYLLEQLNRYLSINRQSMYLHLQSSHNLETQHRIQRSLNVSWAANFAGLEIELPQEPSENQIIAAEQALDYQLKWTAKICAMYQDLNSSERVRVPFPNSPLTPSKVELFVRQVKQVVTSRPMWRRFISKTELSGLQQKRHVHSQWLLNEQLYKFWKEPRQPISSAIQWQAIGYGKISYTKPIEIFKQSSGKGKAFYYLSTKENHASPVKGKNLLAGVFSNAPKKDVKKAEKVWLPIHKVLDDWGQTKDRLRTIFAKASDTLTDEQEPWQPMMSLIRCCGPRVEVNHLGSCGVFWYQSKSNRVVALAINMGLTVNLINYAARDTDIQELHVHAQPGDLFVLVSSTISKTLQSMSGMDQKLLLWCQDFTNSNTNVSLALERLLKKLISCSALEGTVSSAVVMCAMNQSLDAKRNAQQRKASELKVPSLSKVTKVSTKEDAWSASCPEISSERLKVSTVRLPEEKPAGTDDESNR